MSEPQYANYKDIPRESLGLMSNEIWQRDPKMLGIHLARYKFVAKMLTGKRRVAEIGCGDGWYSRIVKQNVGSLEIFDFDNGLINDFKKYHNKIWHVLPELHDINQQPLFLPLYDAIYSLDCFEHIRREDFYAALNNTKKSLIEDGIFIIGMPSLESQQYASKASKIGHINCMGHDELKEHLLEFFRNVFMFGMNDEALHTGYGPMCHYLLGVCCGVR